MSTWSGWAVAMLTRSGCSSRRHRLEVGVATFDVVGVGHPVEGDFVDIAERHQFGGVGMHVGVGVVAPHTATHHDCPQRFSGHAQAFRTSGARHIGQVAPPAVNRLGPRNVVPERIGAWG